jgi:hypothetical protein
MTHIVTAALALALVMPVACRQQASVVPTPAMAPSARFVATSPNNSTTPSRDRCWLAGRFDGAAVVRDGELEVMISRAWIAVTRDNDKKWDDLHLIVQVSGHPLGPQRYIEITRSLPIVLRPTVDSAGPQLSTWQSAETLHLLVPWQPAVAPRWLVFDLNYQTVSYEGKMSSCAGTLGTDTLRFSRSDGGRMPND